MQRPIAISYAVFAVLLVFLAVLHLGTPFLVALFCYLALSRLTFFGKKWIAVVLFLILIVAAFSGAVFFLKRAFVVLPEIVETALPIVVRFAAEHGIELPFTDIESLRTVALDSVRNTLGDLGKYVRVVTKEFVFLLIGIVIAVSVFMNPKFEAKRVQGRPKADLYNFYTSRIQDRFSSFYRSFENVMGAQLIISAINATLTAIFVFAVGLPYGSLVIILTFVCGLIPIVGNLLSNAIIIGIAFTVSPRLAGWAFLFLIVIHKLEYFLNSRIIGGRLDHPMWLMLLSMLIGERLMGISGVVLAPVILSFAKLELKKIELGHEPVLPLRPAPQEREVVQV
ncbi:MAG: AI-2E family transporter [Chthoniobacterales bacterium]